MLILLLALLWFTSHPARLQHLALFCPTPESMLLGLKHAASGIAWRVRKQWQFEGRKRRSHKKQSYLLFHRFLHCTDATDIVFHDIHHNALIMYNVRRYLRVLRVIVLAQVVSFFKNWGVCVQHSEMQTCKLSLETWTCESGLAYNLWVLVVLRSVFPFKKDCRIVNCDDVRFDPLDGSSNVDAGIAVGTIFGIFKARLLDRSCSWSSWHVYSLSGIWRDQCRLWPAGEHQGLCDFCDFCDVGIPNLADVLNSLYFQDLDVDQVSCLAATLQPGKVQIGQSDKVKHFSFGASRILFHVSQDKRRKWSRGLTPNHFWD